MTHHVGLDVSQEMTHLCVIGTDGKIVWQGKCLSTPEDIPGTIRSKAPDVLRIGLESGPLSTWHWHALKAMGLPVVTTPNVSDTDDIIRRERVGVIVKDHSDEAYRQALADLLGLLEDPQTPQRCRRAAETHYALDSACRRQALLYDSLCHSAPGDAHHCEAASASGVLRPASRERIK